jgi:Transposase IS116/IS110/IS902 family
VHRPLRCRARIFERAQVRRRRRDHDVEQRAEPQQVLRLVGDARHTCYESDRVKKLTASSSLTSRTKRKQIAVHHVLEEYMDAYLTATGIGEQKGTPLFRTARGKTGQLTDHRMMPRQQTTGGRPRLLGITKRGNKYLRMLFIHGARAAMAA